MTFFGIFTAPTFEGSVTAMMLQCIFITATAVYMGWIFRKRHGMTCSMSIANLGWLIGLSLLAFVQSWGFESRWQEYQALHGEAGWEYFLQGEFVAFTRWSLAAATVGLIVAWLVLKVGCRKATGIAKVNQVKPVDWDAMQRQ